MEKTTSFKIEREDNVLVVTDEYGDGIAVDKYCYGDNMKTRISIEDAEGSFCPGDGGFQFDFSVEEFKQFLDEMTKIYNEAVESNNAI